MQALYEQLFSGKSLTTAQSEAFFGQVMRGEIAPVELAAMLTALKFRGESPEEIAGAANAMTDHALTFPRPDYDFADIVGTGGDGHNTINISSAAAIVAAASGLKVAKHGNRSVSSKSGSADLFAEFGLKLDMPPATARNCLDQSGLCFLFAPVYHAGVAHAMPVRQALKSRTLFNLLGPLANPARPSHIMIGVYSADLLQPFASTLALMGYQNAAVVHGAGLDEVSLHGTTEVIFLHRGEQTRAQLTAEDFGLPAYALDEIKGGEPAENKALIEALLRGKGQAAHVHAVAANAGLLLYLAGKAQSIKQATQMAMQTIASGQPYETIQHAAEVSRG